MRLCFFKDRLYHFCRTDLWCCQYSCNFKDELTRCMICGYAPNPLFWLLFNKNPTYGRCHVADLPDPVLKDRASTFFNL